MKIISRQFHWNQLSSVFYQSEQIIFDTTDRRRDNSRNEQRENITASEA